MSGPPSAGGRSGTPTTGPAGGSMSHHPPPQHPPAQSSGPGQAGGAAGSAGNMSQANLNSIVIEYLSKKGYSRTEAMLRVESAHTDKDGRPILQKDDAKGPERYFKGLDMTRTFVDQSLEIYKPELRRLLWPLFVHSFLDLVNNCFIGECERFFNTYKDLFGSDHEEDLRSLAAIRLPEHVASNNVAQIYLKNKYRITLTSMAYFSLISFLESKDNPAGSIIMHLLQLRCDIKTVERGNMDPHSLAGLMNRARMENDMPGEDEGIPGHNPGSADTRKNAAADGLPKLRLGALPMEPELRGDVETELEEEDSKVPPTDGQTSLLEEFRRIKREESDDGPARTEIPLPPSMARDVAMEVQRVKEHRARFKIDTRTGGVGPGLSVCMFTFHNTYDTINTLEFSSDNLLVACGTADSYIRVFSLDGRPLTSIIPAQANDPPPSSSRMLIGHSGPVYALSFSPSTTPSPSATLSEPSTSPRYLLSSSADKTVRLWLLDTWSCLVVYKGHSSPVWDITWGPFGHYFVTGGHDRTARLWTTDHIAYVRMFVGHDDDVDTVAFHPNSAYVFTGSSDRTVRMWSVVTGEAVRLFTGHTGNVTCLACAPNGKTLASADDHGAILLWDLATGRRLKRMRGHAKGGIWSMDWTVEGSVLVSGGMDGTVRVWDVLRTPDTTVVGKVIAEGGAGAKIDVAGGTAVTTEAGPTTNPVTTAATPATATTAVTPATTTGAPAGATPAATAATTAAAAAAAAAAAMSGVGAKKKGKEVVVSPEQISAFPTKKSPVYKVKVTRQNLVVAGGAYMP